MNITHQQTNPVILKFLNMLIDYLSQGIIPNIYCKNIQLMQEMFVMLRMDPKYLSYLLNQFKKRSSKYALRILTTNEINNLHTRIRGEAEYLSLCDLSNNDCLKFYIGPYDYPIKIIN